MIWEPWPERRLAEMENEERDLRAELVDLFHRNLPAPVLALNVLFAGILAALLWPHVGHGLLLGWVGAIAAVAAVNHWRHRRYRAARDRGQADPDFWARYYVRGPLLNGLAWGVGGAFMYVPTAPLPSMFVLLVICGVAAGSVASQASLPRALHAFLFTALLIPAARIAAIGNDHGVVAFLLVVYLGFLLFIARSNHATLEESVRLRLRNERLVEALREGEAHFRALVENSTYWVLLLRVDGRLLFQSPSGERLLGYRPAELLDINVGELLHPDDRADFLAQLRRATGASEVLGGDARWRHRNGHWVLLNSVGRLLDGPEPRVLVTARDVTATRAMEAELRTAKENAEAANRVKDRFLANMSHEMRSPLHAIQGVADLLGNTSLDVRQQGYVNALRESAQHLRALVDDVLDYARAESDALRLDEASFDLRAWLETTAGLLAPEAEERGLRFEWSMEENLPAQRMGDPRRLRQVLVNLVTNALKFTEQGAVRVTVSTQGGGVRFEVTDTGCGIPADKHDFIFEPFTQVDSSATRAVGGAGLGLAISRRLVQAMGGTIRCESRPGAGSRFTVDLPLPEAPAQAAGSTERKAPAVLPPARILVVDDAPMNRYVIGEFFRDTPCHLDMANNGREAVESFTREPYDLVLMDMQMPDMDGREATRLIRQWEAREGRPPAPVVALTAGALLDEREAALAAGCNAFIAKPVSRADLLAVVAQLLESHAAAACSG
ncbi:MAG: ATP-binding protein [Thiohalomonadaceae bacterium]